MKRKAADRLIAIEGELLGQPNEFWLADEPRSEDGQYVSEERYWADYYSHPHFNYEWNNGRLEEKPLSDYAQYQFYLWFIRLLEDFLHVYPIARMIGLDTGFRMQLPQKIVIRKPDLGVVLYSNAIPLGDKDRSYHGIFDLCIESLSDSSRKEVRRDTFEKKSEYAAAGVVEYFILDERGQETAFYRLADSGVYLPIVPQDGVIISSGLPGFQFRVADLYSRPEPPEMIEDPIYRSFVSPYFRAERLRTEEERLRAEEEQMRAEKERLRAEQSQRMFEQEQKRAEQAEASLLTAQQQLERYAALLRAKGIEV